MLIWRFLLLWNVLECSDPGAPVNGARLLSGLTPGSTVTFSCDADFRLEGATFARCAPNGQWQGDQVAAQQPFPPRCEGERQLLMSPIFKQRLEKDELF